MDRLREAMGAPVPAREREAYAHDLATARNALGDTDRFESSWQDGRAMSLDDAIARALQDD